MLNPLRQLKGKLNHLKLPTAQVNIVLELANSLSQSPSSGQFFESTSLEEIQLLKSETNNLSTKQFYKFLFDLQCHQQQCQGSTPNSIFQPLIAPEKKVSAHIHQYLAKLNSAQLKYLNIKMQQLMNSEIPHWENLHLNNDSPSKRDILMSPTLKNNSLQAEVKSVPKKTVMPIVKKFVG